MGECISNNNDIKLSMEYHLITSWLSLCILYNVINKKCNVTIHSTMYT